MLAAPPRQRRCKPRKHRKANAQGDISPDIVLAITAAVAAFLGKAGDNSPNSPDRNDRLGDAGTSDGTGFARNCQMVSIVPG